MKLLFTLLISFAGANAFAGFTCINGIQNSGILISSGGASIQMNEMQKCEEAVARAKNGFTCVEYIQSAMLARENGPAVYMESMESCLKALESSK